MKGGPQMKIKAVFLSVFFAVISAALAAENGVIQSGDNPASGGVNTAAGPAPNTYTAQAKLLYRNALGIELVMPGRIIPGISYSRFIFPDVFATVYTGLAADPDGAEVLISLNGYKLFNEFFYAGLGIGSIFDKGMTVLTGVLNPSAGLMARITPEITLYTEGTAWLLRLNTNNNVGVLAGNTVLIFKAGVKYNFSWLDPFPDIKDMTK
jgi:uncharacterized protein YdeI (BOF family)